MSRVVLAFLIAPATPAWPILFFSLFLVFSDPSSLFNVVGAFLLFVVPVAYPVPILLGLPIYLTLKNKPQYQKKKFYVMAGALLGFVEFFLLLGLEKSSTESAEQLIFIALFFIIAGGVSALVFWLIAKPSQQVSHA